MHVLTRERQTPEKKNDPAEGQLDEVNDTSIGENMSTSTVPLTADMTIVDLARAAREACIPPSEMLTRWERLPSVRARLDQITAQIRDIREARRNLLRDTIARLAAEGIEACRIYHSKGSPIEISEGDIVTVSESFWRHGEGHKTIRQISINRSAAPSGVWAHSYRMYGEDRLNVGISIEHGVYRVMLIDETDVLAVRVSDQDSESEYRKSVSRLRNLARRESLRIRQRDREITLIDPLDNAVHVGDLVSAFAFILNIDTAVEVFQ